MLAALLLAMVPSADPFALSVDRSGVLRTADGSRAGFFGANYCLPSGQDYRAAGRVGADRKSLVRQDLLHFARLGWNAIRLSFWGDYENSDAQGNLVANDHLDLLCFTIHEAERRGLTILFSPVVAHDSRWPEMAPDPKVAGFSTVFEKSRMGLDPAAIAAQQHYWRQLLTHRNPYSGRLLKDEPPLRLAETINEPWHHPDDSQRAIAYIDGLVGAIRSTGYQGLVFHNVSQDFRMGALVDRSTADGGTFGWYPTGLMANRILKGNVMPHVSEYRPVGMGKPKLFYEFDAADTDTATAYPAMTRAMRAVGAQYAAMFSYDMLATAPTNLGWQTHVLNLVTTPKKAVSSAIAAEVMRGGEATLDPVADTAVLATVDRYLFAGDVRTPAPAPSELRRVVGWGRSPVASYEGTGAFFLDRLGPGDWRLEVHPDVVQVADPFRNPRLDRPAYRVFWRERQLSLQLPDLGKDFRALPLNAGNTYQPRVRAGSLEVRPGVYRLIRSGVNASTASVGRVGLTEFETLPTDTGPAQVMLPPSQEVVAGARAWVNVMVAASESPEAVDLMIGSRRVRMTPSGPFRYAVRLPQGLAVGDHHLRAVARWRGGEAVAEGRLSVLRASEPVLLFDPSTAKDEALASRDGDLLGHDAPVGESPEGSRLVLAFPDWIRGVPRSPTVEFPVRPDLAPRIAALRPRALRIWLQNAGAAQSVRLTLVEVDGRAFSADLTATPSGREHEVPWSAFAPSSFRLLPMAYPNGLREESEVIAAGRPDPRRLQRLQVTPLNPPRELRLSLGPARLTR